MLYFRGIVFRWLVFWSILVFSDESSKLSQFRGILFSTFHRIVFQRLLFRSIMDFCDKSSKMSRVCGIVFSTFRQIVFRRLVFRSNLVLVDELKLKVCWSLWRPRPSASLVCHHPVNSRFWTRGNAVGRFVTRRLSVMQHPQQMNLKLKPFVFFFKPKFKWSRFIQISRLIVLRLTLKYLGHVNNRLN